MLRVWLHGVELAAPGLTGWTQGLAVLSGRQPYRPQPMERYIPTALPANERRRVSPTTRLALQVIEPLLARMAPPPPTVGAVFTSSGGDMDIVHQICTALTLPDRFLSPTQFHNSVHNAPAGYFAIATGSRQTANCLAAFDGSLAAGLLEAAALVITEAHPTLLVAYDLPAPPPLFCYRPLAAPFGAALLLGPEALPGSLGMLVLETVSGEPEDRLEDPLLEQLRVGNPAARCLPLLAALLKPPGDSPRRVVLPWLDQQQLAVECRPC